MNEYRIHIKGHLDPHWADWFDNLTIFQYEDGTTILTGPIIDQPALYGVIHKLRDLGLELLSVKRQDNQSAKNLC